jgi:DNA-binding NarL/FixJ family response regulator
MLVRELLADDAALAVVGEAGTADDAVDGVARLRPDVVLLDRLGDPGLVGRVRSAAPGVRVVVLSGRAGLPDAGVDAVVVKSPFVDELRATVLRVAGARA